MLQASIYYYPQTNVFGHIAVKIRFAEDEIPDRKIRVVKRIEMGKNFLKEDYRDNSYYKYDQHQARYHHQPMIIKEKGKYFIYGQKDGVWQETELASLTEQESMLLDNFTKKEPEPVEPEQIIPLLKKGHHSIKRTEYFFDWGGCFDMERDYIEYGKPIRIDLPKIDKSWSDFHSAIEETDYRWYYTNNTAQKKYNYLKNNCAHAVLQVLYMAGYIENQPKFSFGLTPHCAATQVAKLANNTQRLSQKKLITELKPNQLSNEQCRKIKALIEGKIIQLKNEINFGSLLTNSKAKTKERELLSRIQFDGSPESVGRLLYAYETVSSSTADELNSCIAILPPLVLLKASLLRLDKIAKNLEHESFPKEAKQLRLLVSNLEDKVQKFKDKKIPHESFVRDCSTLIDGAEKVLNNHYDYRRLFNNIALAIVGLGVIYLIAVLANKAVKGNFLFFGETKLSKITTDIKHFASNCIPSENSAQAGNKYNSLPSPSPAI